MAARAAISDSPALSRPPPPPVWPRQARPPTARTPHTGLTLFYAKDGALLYVSDPASMPGLQTHRRSRRHRPGAVADGSRVAFAQGICPNGGGASLWVLDLSADGARPPAPRRLVDPMALVPTFDGDDPAKST